jgi:hypothetical protein
VTEPVTQSVAHRWGLELSIVARQIEVAERQARETKKGAKYAAKRTQERSRVSNYSKPPKVQKLKRMQPTTYARQAKVNTQKAIWKRKF